MSLSETIRDGWNVVSNKLSQHGPEIMTVGGVLGLVGAAVLACKATTKLDNILEERKERLNQVDEVLESPEFTEEEYNLDDAKKDKVIINIQTGWKIIKKYAPALILAGLSIVLIFTSNGILKKRNAALAAAYTTIDTSYREYRKRVVDRFGEEVDRELRHNIKKTKIEKIVVDEKGKEKKVEEEIEVVSNEGKIPGYSDYARFYDDGCREWQKNAEYNLTFLKAQQAWANDILKSRGRRGKLYLNEVYDLLGIPRSEAGQVVGWIYDPDNPDHTGDNYVDFGIYDLWKVGCRNFVNGYERTILLDFNVDGYILNK